MSSPEQATAPHTLDCLGKACPVPVIELAKVVAGMAVADEVVVLSDDAGAKVDIPVWCRMKQHTLVDVTEADGVFTFVVRKAR